MYTANLIQSVWNGFRKSILYWIEFDELVELMVLLRDNCLVSFHHFNFTRRFDPIENSLQLNNFSCPIGWAEKRANTCAKYLIVPVGRSTIQVLVQIDFSSVYDHHGVRQVRIPVLQPFWKGFVGNILLILPIVFYRYADGTVRLRNPNIELMDQDILYHLALGSESHDLHQMFGDVKVNCYYYPNNGVTGKYCVGSYCAWGLLNV